MVLYMTTCITAHSTCPPAKFVNTEWVWLLAASIHVLLALAVLCECYVCHNLESIIITKIIMIKCKLNKCYLHCHVCWFLFLKKKEGVGGKIITFWGRQNSRPFPDCFCFPDWKSGNLTVYFCVMAYSVHFCVKGAIALAHIAIEG